MIPPGFVDISAIVRAGIYLLLWKGEVVYVGQSIKLYQRIGSHCHSRAKYRKVVLSKKTIRGVVFDQIYVMPCALSDLDRMELELIQQYQPRYNEKGKTQPPIELGELLKALVQSPPKPTGTFRRRA